MIEIEMRCLWCITQSHTEIRRLSTLAIYEPLVLFGLLIMPVLLLLIFILLLLFVVVIFFVIVIVIVFVILLILLASLNDTYSILDLLEDTIRLHQTNNLSRLTELDALILISKSLKFLIFENLDNFIELAILVIVRFTNLATDYVVSK